MEITFSKKYYRVDYQPFKDWCFGFYDTVHDSLYHCALHLGPVVLSTGDTYEP